MAPLLITLVVAVLAVLALFRDELVKSSGQLKMEYCTSEDSLTLQADSLYNHAAYGRAYQLTFLEFGAGFCTACKAMKAEVEQVREQHGEVKVVFIDVTTPEGSLWADHYGVMTIPAQILLNRQGEPYYRHVDFISATDLAKHF